MCLVFLAYQVDQQFPVMLGANREESRRRPTTPPVCVRRERLRCLLAGADRGPDGSFPEIGTWLGVNETGLVVAVSNRRDGALAFADQIHSRGTLAVALLGFDDVERAAEFARNELAGGGYGGCNYLIANTRGACIVEAPGARHITTKRLAPGVHAMTNLDVNDPADPRIAFVFEQLDCAHFAASAQRICRDPRVVVRGVDRGTVSSSVIVAGQDVSFHHILGDPSAGEYQQFSAFVR